MYPFCFKDNCWDDTVIIPSFHQTKCLNCHIFEDLNIVELLEDQIYFDLKEPEYVVPNNFA